MNEFYVKMGQRVWQLRYEAGLSREVLSEMAEISPKFLYDVENGNKGMSAHNLYKLSNALSVSCDYLLTGTEYKNTDRDDKIEIIKNIADKFDSDKLPAIEKIFAGIAELAG